MALTKVPSNLDATIATTQSQADNSTNIATTAYVDLAVSNLSDSAPAALNTLNEIAAALGDDANYASTTTAAIADKLPLSGGAMTGAITTNSTFDGVDIAVRDAILTSTTTTANAALPKAGGTMTGDLQLYKATPIITLQRSDNTTLPGLSWQGSGGTEAASIKLDGTSGMSNSLVMSTHNGSSVAERLRILTAAADGIQVTGNVGIGTSSPTFTATSFKGIEVEVSGDLFPNVRLERVSGSSKTNQAYEMVIGSLGNWHVRNATTASAPLSIATDDSIHMTGHLGVGTPGYGTYHSDTVVLGLGTGSTIRAANSGADPYVTMANNAYHDASSWKYIHADFASSYEQYNGTHVWNTAASGSAGATVPFGPRMKIDAAGDVLIGQTSQTGYAFAQKLVVGDGDNNDGITIQSGGTHQGNLAFNHSDGTTAHGRISYQHQTNYMQFFVNNSEKMRISSSGLVEIGQSYTANANASVLRLSGMSTSAYSGGLEWYSGYGPKTTAEMHSTASGSQGGEWWLNCRNQNSNAMSRVMAINNVGRLRLSGLSETCSGALNVMGEVGNSYDAIQFYHNSMTLVGRIRTTASSTSYNTSSDYRLKENVVTDWDATTRLKQLKPSRFNFITDADNTVDGFLAHEVSSVVPEAITGTKDAVDSEGNPDYQGIDQSKLVPLLVKTIQELEARITTLEG